MLSHSWRISAAATGRAAVTELLRAFYWFTPAGVDRVPTAALESEHACDDEVMTRGVDARLRAHLIDCAIAQSAAASFFLRQPGAPLESERRVRAM